MKLENILLLGIGVAVLWFVAKKTTATVTTPTPVVVTPPTTPTANTSGIETQLAAILSAINAAKTSAT